MERTDEEVYAIVNLEIPEGHVFSHFTYDNYPNKTVITAVFKDGIEFKHGDFIQFKQPVPYNQPEIRYGIFDKLVNDDTMSLLVQAGKGSCTGRIITKLNALVNINNVGAIRLTDDEGKKEINQALLEIGLQYNKDAIKIEKKTYKNDELFYEVLFDTTDGKYKVHECKYTKADVDRVKQPNVMPYKPAAQAFAVKLNDAVDNIYDGTFKTK